MKHFVLTFMSVVWLVLAYGCQSDVTTNTQPTTTTTIEATTATTITTTTVTTTTITTTQPMTTPTTTTVVTEATTTTEAVVVTRSETVYLSGTADEFTVYKFATNVPGPTFFIIGGIHGNERAGWMAAQAMLDYDFVRGTVYVLPVANARAAYADPPVRFLSGWTDLNREFPGSSQGTATEKLALAIFNAIVITEPDIVLDLHESRYGYDKGGLGNSLILHLGSQSFYATTVIEQFNALPLQDGQPLFTLFNAPPEGSINREFTEAFSVPVITIETNRDAILNTIASEQVPLTLRIQQQLAMIEIFLATFDLP